MKILVIILFIFNLNLMAQTQAVKAEQENLVLEDSRLNIFLGGFYGNDIKKKNIDQEKRKLNDYCQDVQLKQRERFMKAGLTENDFVLRTTVKELQLTPHKYGKFYTCELNVNLEVFAATRNAYFKYTIHPLISTKDHYNKNSTIQKEFITKNIFHYFTSRITDIHSRKPGSDISLDGGQFIGVTFYVKEEVKEPVAKVCDSSKNYIFKVKAKDYNKKSLINNFPYSQKDIRPAKLGEYEFIAKNFKATDNTGKNFALFAEGPANEERQIAFSFNLAQENLPENLDTLVKSYVKFNANKSVRKSVHNPKFNNTEILCLLQGAFDKNLCSGRFYEGEWKDLYLNNNFRNNTYLAGTAFSEQIKAAHDSLNKNSLMSYEFFTYKLWFSMTELFGENNGGKVNNYIESSVKNKSGNLEWVMADDMYIYPESLELVLEFTCK